MPYIADRVQETITTIGTGPITLNFVGNIPGYLSVAEGIGYITSSAPAQLYYCITDGSDWEIGTGTMVIVGPNIVLLRATDDLSTSTGSLLNLSGTSTLMCTVTAKFLTNASIGSQLAVYRGFAMP